MDVILLSSEQIVTFLAVSASSVLHTLSRMICERLVGHSQSGI